MVCRSHGSRYDVYRAVGASVLLRIIKTKSTHMKTLYLSLLLLAVVAMFACSDDLGDTLGERELYGACV